MHANTSSIQSPFGEDSHIIQTLSTAHICELYRKKCGVDIIESFHGNDFVHLFECTKTGYRFWRPAEIAGDERFYQLLNNSWPDYYKTHRWEYPLAREALRDATHILEIGCGRGYFLKSTEGWITNALGLEFNKEAIATKVTRFPMKALSIEQLSSQSDNLFDAICSFQVLEHVQNPKQFIESSLKLLSPNGLLVLSTPNYAHIPFQEQKDALDLPPHHMGHFNKNTFEKIADFFNLEIITLESEIRKHTSETVTDLTRNNLAFQISRALASQAYNLAYNWTKEPGPNLLAIFRKRRQ